MCCLLFVVCSLLFVVCCLLFVVVVGFGGRSWNQKSSAKKAQHSANLAPKWVQSFPKSSPDGAQRRQNGAKMAPRWGQDGEKIKEKHQRNKEEGCLFSPPPPGAEKVANIAPTWVPSCSQDASKIDAKMHHFFDASWNRFLGGFWWILGTKIQPSWYQNGIKNRC